MKKTAIITDSVKQCFEASSKSGGGYVVAQNLIKELAKMPEVELTVFTGNKGYYEIPNVKVVEIQKNVWDKTFYDDAEKLVEEEKFDIVLRVNLPQNTWNSLLQCHSFVHRCEVESFFVRPFKRFLSRKKIAMQKEVFSKVSENTKFFAMSKTVKKDYEKHFGLNPDNVFAIYPACVHKFETCPKKDKKDKITFGVVANSSLNKGGHFLVFVLGLVKLLGFDFSLKIILPKFEKDVFMKGLIKLFGLSKNIEILPHLDNMTEFYESIDVLVLPSLNEAFGLVVLEAMSAGVPCLLSSTAGAVEIIGRENGFVFDRKSLNDFVKKLKNIILIYSNEFERFKKYRQSAFETAKGFTWKKFAEEIVKTF